MSGLALSVEPGARRSSGKLAQKRLFGREQRRRHSATPLSLSGRQLNQILAYLDLDMRDAATLAVLSVWSGLTISYLDGSVPPSFAIMAVATAVYVGAVLWRSRRRVRDDLAAS